MNDKLKPFEGIDFEALSKLLTAAKAVEYLASEGVEISVDRLRGLARQGKVPGAGKVVGKVAFVQSALKDWKPPEGVGISRREDGRRPYKLYLLPEEKAAIEEGGIGEFAKPKKRKTKAEKAKHGPPTVEADEADPFDAFGA